MWGWSDLGGVSKDEDIVSIAQSGLSLTIGAALEFPGGHMSGAHASNDRLKVFISYSRKDLAFAERIFEALQSRGLAPTIDTRDLPALEDWKRELLGFIRETDAVVFIVSPNSISSSVCAWEIEQVTVLNKRLAPVVLDRVGDDGIALHLVAIIAVVVGEERRSGLEHDC